MLCPSSSDRYTLIDDILDYIKDNHIYELQDIVDYARNNKRETWFPLLCDNSAIVSQYIKSQRHRRFIYVDKSTGEVFE